MEEHISSLLGISAYHDMVNSGSSFADAHMDDDDVADPSRLRSHQRGKAPFVFVPWESIADSPLNLPVSKMNFYVSG